MQSEYRDVTTHTETPSHRPLDKGADRGALQTDDQGVFSTSTDATVCYVSGPFAVQGLRSHMRPPSTAPGLALSHSTIDGYRRIMRIHVAPYFGELKLDKLTASRLARHYRELSTNGRKDGRGDDNVLSANTVNKIHVALGAMLDAAIDDGYIAINPARKSRTVEAPTASQIRAQRPEAVTWTASELWAFLTWDREVYDDNYHALWLCIREARKALGVDNLKPLTIKGLRHTHATLLLELSIHPKVVQECLGHSNISTTMNIYSHVTPTMQKDAVERLATLLSRANQRCCMTGCIVPS